MNNKNYHKVPLEFGETFFINNSKAITECTFIGIGVCMENKRKIAYIAFFDEDNLPKKYTQVQKNSGVTFHKTIKDALYRRDNIFPYEGEEVINKSVLCNFIEENGYNLVVGGNPYWVRGYVFDKCTIKKCQCFCNIVPNVLNNGNPKIIIDTTPRGLNCDISKDVTKAYLSVDECLANSNVDDVIKLKKNTYSATLEYGTTTIEMSFNDEQSFLKFLKDIKSANVEVKKKV